MAKTPKKTEPKPRRGSANLQRRKPPEQPDLPGTEVKRDKVLEQAGRDIEAATDSINALRTELLNARIRAARRLEELKLTVYRTAGGKVLTATAKTQIKLSKAKKRANKRKVEG